MAKGAESRQRRLKLTVRFNEAEARAIRERAERSGVSMASLLRVSVMEALPLPATRRPTVNHQEVARILGAVGRIASVLQQDAPRLGVRPENPHVAAALRDLSEIRVACFQALGRKP